MSEASASAEPIEPLAASRAEIERLGLESYIETLDEQGFVLLPPEVADPGGLAPRMLESILDVAERRSGHRPDLDGGSSHVDFKVGNPFIENDSPWGEMVKSLIHEGPVFEEAMMNPVVLALVTHLCGYSAILSSYSALVKGPNKSDFDFHSDILLPAPWPDHALVCNATYVLTPFDREHGSTAFVPGSHKWGHGPTVAQSKVDEHPDAVAIEAEPGSVFVWHGNTWHGAFHREKSGLRVSTPILFARPYMRTEEDLFGNVSEESLERNVERFAWITQQGISYGWANHEDALKRSPRAFEYMERYAEAMDGIPRLNPMDYEGDLING
ncbi:MAG: phytanoyl-CoA dioxygenase family protein [Myxococcota bacterium]